MERADINQQDVFAQDQITIKNLTISAGLRFDNYEGISQDKLLQPRVGFSYLVKMTGTVIRGSYTRAMETPYNENLVLSSNTGAGGLATNVFGAYASTPLRPGHRNQYSVGLEQAIKKYVQIEANYFWKFTKDAFDFDTLFNTSDCLPHRVETIEDRWRVFARFHFQLPRLSSVLDRRPHAIALLRSGKWRLDFQFPA